jgi:hypothetical protein
MTSSRSIEHWAQRLLAKTGNDPDRALALATKRCRTTRGAIRLRGLVHVLARIAGAGDKSEPFARAAKAT